MKFPETNNANRVSRRSTAGLLVCLLLSMTSCSISGSTTTTSVHLPPLKSASSLKRIERSPDVYVLSQNGEEVFLTVIKECGINGELPGSAHLRQLFVGMSELKMLEQTAHTIGDNIVLASRLTARVDGDKIALLSCSHLSGDCVSDIVFWARFSPNDDRIGALGFPEEIVRELLPTLKDRS